MMTLKLEPVRVRKVVGSFRLLSFLAVSSFVLIAAAFRPLFPCGARPLTTAEKETAQRLFSSIDDQYLGTWHVPCGGNDLDLEDRVRVAEIVREHSSDMKMFPFVLRIEFQGIYVTAQGSKAYDFVGRTFFGLPLNKMRVAETGGCGRIIGGWESFGEAFC